jgi:hypothetical protein
MIGLEFEMSFLGKRSLLIIEVLRFAADVLA